MDAAAYLTNQGWRGDGHALHHSGRGITKPIRISQKANVLGVGKKQHDAHADQWWARTFNDTLKGLNTTKNEATGKTEGIAFGSGAQALQMVGTGGARWVGQGGLYSNFVRGESLNGTLTAEEKDHRETQSQSEDRRKRGKGSNDVDLTTAEAKDVKRSKRKRRQQEGGIAEHSKLVVVDSIQHDPKDVRLEEKYQKPRERTTDTETKEQRRQRKRERKARKALEAGGCRKLSEQPRAKSRSKVQLHAVEDAEPLATRPCNASPPGKRSGKSGKQQREVDF